MEFPATVTFGPTLAQRGERLFAGICLVMCATGIFVFHGRAGKGAVGLVIGGVAGAVLGMLLLASSRAQTIIDGQGVRTRSAFGRRSCPWSEVTDIEMGIEADPMTYFVKVHCRDGRSFTLPAPTDSEDKSGRHGSGP
jgi:hypothetical protein